MLEESTTVSEKLTNAIQKELEKMPPDTDTDLALAKATQNIVQKIECGEGEELFDITNSQDMLILNLGNIK
jgi:hypothetical protein